MSTKDPQRVFPPYAANVTKKTAKVTEFMNQNAGDAATLGPRKLDTLAQLMQSLREQLGQMEVALDEQRGANMENKTFERIQKMVDKSVDSGTAVLDRASQFMHEQENGPTNPAQGQNPSGGKLDNNLHPTTKLSKTMTLEESTTWLKAFEAYLEWNKAALVPKSKKDIRHLLESCLDAGLTSKLETDKTVKPETTVQGEDGMLKKLKNYFLDDYPLMMRRHQFTECTQAQGELVKTWWDRVKAKAVECALSQMTEDDMMMLQMIRGVSDSLLQKKLLQEEKPSLAKLVQIAEQWQAADSMQTALGGDSDLFAWKADADPCVKKTPMSEYKLQKSERWKSSRQSSDRQPTLDECSHCGIQGDKMHSKDACPAKDRNCYNCGMTGHFGQVCRRPKQTAQTNLVRVAETHGGGSDPTHFTLVNAASCGSPHTNALAFFKRLCHDTIACFRSGLQSLNRLTRPIRLLRLVKSCRKRCNTELPIQLLTDASRTGVGFCLVQTNVGSKVPLLIMAGSCFLSSAEKNYAVVELELLAIQWAVEKCRLYLAGAEFLIITDHQPLLGILNRKNLDAINNVRIQRLMAKLLGYSFTVEWIAGKNHVIADALSRAPVFAAEDHKDIIIRKVTEEVIDEALVELSNVVLSIMSVSIRTDGGPQFREPFDIW
jgi:hypothetical protein